MLAFIKSNLATIIIVIIILTLVILAIRKIVKDKKSGKGSCGNECAACPYSSECNKK